MDKKAVARMKKYLKSTRSSQARNFGFAPNKGAPVLLVDAREISRATFVRIVEEKLGVPVTGKAIYIGQIIREDDTWRMTVDPEQSAGQISLPKARRGLLQLSKALKVGALKKAIVELPGGGGGDTLDITAIDRDVIGRIKALLADDALAPEVRRQRLGEELAALKELRDALKQNLAVFAELPTDAQPMLRERAIGWQDTLREIRGLRDTVRDALARRPDIMPRVLDTDALALRLTVEEVRGTSKRAARQLAAYHAWLERQGDSIDPAAQRDQLDAIKEALLQSRRDTRSRKKTAQLDALLRTVEEKRTEAEIQHQLDAGYLRTTGGDDQMGGISGSYFVGTEERARAHVFKPLYQENAMPHSGRQIGEGVRGEVVSALLGRAVQEQAGVDLGIPDARLVTLRSERFAEIGRRMRDPMLATAAGTDQRAGRAQQPGALIEGIEGVRGQASDWMRLPHPTREGILLPYVEPTDVDGIADALEEHTPGWSELTLERQAELVRAVQAAEPRLVPPDGLSDERMRGEVFKAAMACIVTGQVDYNNPDNLLITGEGEDTSLRPIDFGITTPGAYLLTRKLDNSSPDDDTPNPWFSWAGMPWAQAPLAGAELDALSALDADALVALAAAESERLSRLSGGDVPALTVEQQELQRAMIKAAQVLCARSRARGLAVTCADLSALFYTDTGQPPSPFLQYLRDLRALKASFEQPGQTVELHADFYTGLFDGTLEDTTSFAVRVDAWLDARATPG